jgi:hypothetical protein
VGDVDDDRGAGTVGVDRAQARGVPGDAPRGVGAAVERIDDDHHLALDVVDARLLGQHAHASPAQHGQRGLVGGDVAEVLAVPRAGRAPIGEATQRDADRLGRIVQEVDQSAVGESHLARSTRCGRCRPWRSPLAARAITATMPGKHHPGSCTVR